MPGVLMTGQPEHWGLHSLLTLAQLGADSPLLAGLGEERVSLFCAEQLGH